MASPLKSEIIRLYNHVWASPYTMVQVSGMWLFAADNPHILQRYVHRDPGGKKLWEVRFEFKRDWKGEDEIMAYTDERWRTTREVKMHKGVVKLTKFEGDHNRMKSDLTIAKVFL